MEQTQLDTASEVEMYFTRAKRYCRAWHTQIEHRRSLYDQNHYKVKARQGEERYEDPTYTNVVDLAVGAILANDLEFKAFGWSPSQQEQQDSDKIEKFLAGLIQINSEREELFIPYEVLLHFVRDGAAVLYSVWDPTIADEERVSVPVPVEDEDGAVSMQSREGYREPPLRLQVIDPLKIFMIPGGPGRWLHIFRVEELPVVDVEMRYNIAVKRYVGYNRAQKEEIKGKLIDYWRLSEVDEPGSLDAHGRTVNRTRRVVEHALVFENESIYDLHEMEGYTDLPFTIGFFKPVSRDNPEGWGHSIIDPLESTISMMERSVNRRQFQITRYSGMPLLIKRQPGRSTEIDPALGSVIELGPDEDVRFPQWQGNPPDVEQQIGFYRARAQQSGFSDVMFGSGPSQASGYGLSQLGDQNRIRLEQPVQHLQLLWSRWAKKALHLCETFAPGEVVRVYGQMRGREFTEQVVTEGISEYNVQCFVKPEFPNEKVRKHAMATQVMGVLSEHTIMGEYLDIEQPDDERKRKMIEMAQKHPLAMQYAITKNLREMAEQGDADAAIVLQQLLSQGQPGTPGPVPGPRSPEQPMGLAGPTGQPAPQARGQPAPGQDDAQTVQDLAGLSPQMNL